MKQMQTGKPVLSSGGRSPRFAAIALRSATRPIRRDADHVRADATQFRVANKMTDLIERLRARKGFVSLNGGGCWYMSKDHPDADAQEAAAEIDRLHAWRDAKNEACAELEKEIERLRAALEPFAHSTEIPDSILSGEMGDEAIVAVTFKLGDFRRACALVTNGDRDGR
jgi:hypothetical protein